MGRERDLQKWCVHQARHGALATHLRGGSRDDSWRYEWVPPPCAGLDLANQSTREAVANIQEVCHEFLEADLVTADKNLALQTGEGYRPDLVMHNTATGSYIIIELKSQANAARQAVTELLAYAEVLREALHNPPIYLVVASEAWPALLASACTGYMRDGRYPLLPLIATRLMDGVTPTGEYELTIRWDLCRSTPTANSLPPHAFVCDTITFVERREYAGVRELTEHINDYFANKMRELAAKADPERTGFLLLWTTGRVWNITSCIVNPARLKPDLLPKSPLARSNPYEPDGIPYLANNVSNSELGYRMLQRLSIDTNAFDTELSGFDDWPQAQLVLRHWDARLVFAIGWGDTAQLFDGSSFDQSAPRYSNLAWRLLPGYHPFHWIHALDRLTGTEFDASDLSQLLTLCRLGELFGAVSDYYACGPDALEDSEDFGFLAATARLIAAWDRICISWDEQGCGNPPVPLEFERPIGARLKQLHIDYRRIWCVQTLCSRSIWHEFAFHLGFACAYAERGRAPRLRHTRSCCVDTANQLLAWANQAPQVTSDPHASSILERTLLILEEKPIEQQDFASRELCTTLVDLADLAFASNVSADFDANETL